MHPNHHPAIAARACRSRLLRIPLLLLLCLLGAGGGLMPALGATLTDANWASLGGIPGANGPVRAMVRDAAGNLYIGGDFTVVGNTVANGVAKWDGTAWSALGEGAGNNDFLGQPKGVKALAILGDELYVGGNFTRAGGVERHGLARWRLTGGGGWSDGGLATGDVKVLLVHNNELYVGGLLARTGSSTENLMLAKWNGSTWTPMSNASGQGVRALAVASGSLYVGGSFGEIAGIPAANIAKWTIGPAVGAGWSSLGAGVEGGFGAEVGTHALQVVGNDLYVGGFFNGSGAIASAGLIRWSITGNAWFPIAAGAPSFVTALSATQDDLFAGGGGVAKWAIGSTDASGWSKMGTGVPGNVNALLLADSTLHVGGQFAYAGGYGRNNLAKWALGGPENDSNWSALAPAGTAVSTVADNAGIKAVAVVGSDLYVGGNFQSVGGVAANNIAKWNGNSWSALGAGIGIVDGWVVAMVSHGTDLYVSGPSGISRWDGSQWHPVGFSSSGFLAMAVAGEDLYVVGDVSFGIRRWRLGSPADANTPWTRLADGVNGTVYSLTLSGQDLYVGGSFSTAGGVAGTRNIAKWRLGSTGSTGWSALGTGVGGPVWSLAAAGGHLYVGGDFTSVGGATRNNIVRWTLGGTDDNNWSPMGSGVSGAAGVRALSVIGNELFVGGLFTSAGGQAGRSGIAKWTLGGTGNSSWAAVGSGISDLAGVVSPGVNALTTAANGDLFVGGRFTIAGNKAAGHVAKLVTASDVTLSGAVKYYPGSAGGPTVPQTTVALTGGPGGSVSTPADGTFSFTVPSGGNYTLTPARNGDNPGNQGVSTLDITLIRRHILATTRLDSAHKVIAADANKSASVTTVDISLIRRLILGIDSKLAAGAWRFIPSSHTFADAQSPWGYPETRSYTGLNASTTGQDFVAVKVGDVNNSWTVGLPLTASSAEPARAAVRPAATGGGNVTFRANPATAAPGSRFKVNLSVAGFAAVTTAQFTLEWNPAVLSYVGTGDYGLTGMAGANFGANNTAAGRLTFSWDDPNATGVTVADGTVIFSVEFDAVGAAGTSSTVAFGNTPTAQEVTVNFEAAAFTAQSGTVTLGTVANVPPTVGLGASPSTVSVGQTIFLAAVANDSDGTVARVEFFNGATKLGEDTSAPFTLEVTSLPAGTHSLTARATDNGGAATTSAAVSVTVNAGGNVPPTVGLGASPTTVNVGQTIFLSAVATDSDGTVAKVEFFNGTTKLGEDTTAPFALAVSTLSAGTHSLTARATDNDGAAATSATVSVTVRGASGDGVTFRANPATAAPGSRFKVNLSVAGFAAVTTAQFTLEWNPAVLSYVGTGDYGLTGMAGANFGANNTAAGRLTFSWDDPNATGVTVADGTVIFSVEFDAVGAAGTSSAVSFGDTPTAREVTVNFEGKSFVGEAGTVTVENVVQNVPPTVSLSASPTSANVGQSVTLTATATDSDGTVAKVEFFDGATKLGEDTTSPYSLVVSTLAAGTHSLTARATDNRGAAATSAAVGVTVNPASGGIAIRRLNGYIPGQLLTVTVSVTPPAGTIAYGIEETPPTGWQVSQISDGGEFDPANGKVKWTFLDATIRSLTYRLTVPANASGSHFFNGIANVDGTSTTTIGGDTELKRADQHPADVNPADWSLGLAEVLRYATAYKKGETWTVPPVPVELGYVIRGFTLYKRGERYQLDPSIATPPGWWVNVGAGAGGSAASVARQASPVESATRELPETYEPAQPLTVSITVAPADGTVAYGVEEVPPAGWLVDQISDTGELDSINGKVKWTFLDGTARTLTYRLTPTAEAQGSATVSGKVNFDGLRELAIGGDTSMSAGSEPPPTAQIGLYAGVLVTGQVGATYVVEGTEDVAGQDGWTELARITLTQPSQLFVDQNSPLKPQQFYRVRRP